MAAPIGKIRDGLKVLGFSLIFNGFSTQEDKQAISRSGGVLEQWSIESKILAILTFLSLIKTDAQRTVLDFSVRKDRENHALEEAKRSLRARKLK
jgi:hypothetical protein